MSVCNCVISVKKCFLSPNNGFLRFCQGKTQIPIKNYILNSTNRITTVLCQKCLTQQAHIIRASTLHPSSTILLLSYIFLCEQKKSEKKGGQDKKIKKCRLIDRQIDRQIKIDRERERFAYHKNIHEYSFKTIKRNYCNDVYHKNTNLTGLLQLELQ